ncbi:MAG: aldolase/citrate lyase family protein [Sneathiellaceae bacterium]
MRKAAPQPTNPIRTAIAEQGMAFGTWIQMNAPEAAELAAAAGLDFVIVDMEHGSFGIAEAAGLIRAVQAGGAAPLVRVPDHDPTGLLKVLDAGAAGVLVPGVETAAQAAAIVAATRFAPDGTRGACPCTRATWHGLVDWPDHLAWAQANILTLLIVESLEGVRNFEEILAVPGIFAIGIGMFDLAQAMGHGGDFTHPAVQAELARLSGQARAAGIEVFSATFDATPGTVTAAARHWRGLGARLFAASADRMMLAAGYRAVTAALAESGRPG